MPHERRVTSCVARSPPAARPAKKEDVAQGKGKAPMAAAPQRVMTSSVTDDERRAFTAAAVADADARAAALAAELASAPRATDVQATVAFAKERAAAGDFLRASALFDEAGTAAARHPLLKFGATGHFTHAALCALAAGASTEDVTRLLGVFGGRDARFEGSLERRRLLLPLLAASTEQEWRLGVDWYRRVASPDAWALAVMGAATARRWSTAFG
jgi:hypothetical protein